MLEIINHPDPRLTKVSRPLTDEEIAGGEILEDLTLAMLIDEMTNLMHNSRTKGIGLAAPQLGINVRLFIAELPDEKTSVFVNPVLSDFKGSDEDTEGCLSLPGIKVRVKRPQMVHVKAKNQKGEEFEIDANGMLAKVVQHEFDHLEGLTILKRGNWAMNKNNREAIADMERIYKQWQDRISKKTEALKPPEPAQNKSS